MIEELKSLEVSPPRGLWEEIDKTLATKKKKKVFIITSWASAATIALLFTIGGLYNMNSGLKRISSSQPKNEIVDNQIIKKEATKKTIKNIESKEIKRNTTVFNSEKQQDKVALNTGSSIIIGEKVERNETFLQEISSIQAVIKITEPKPERIPLLTDQNDNSFLAIVDPEPKKARGNWYASASGFPVYSFHTAGVLNRQSNQQELGIVSWGGSISVRYDFSNRYSFETGITYNIRGQQEKNIYLVYSGLNNAEVSSINGFSNSFGTLSVSNDALKVMDLKSVNSLSYGAVNESNFNHVNALQQFRYIEIPLLFSKGYTIKSIKVSFKAGLTAEFLVGNRLNIKSSYFQMYGKTKGVDPFTSSAIGSIGFSLPIARNTYLLIEPTFKFGLKSLSSSNGKSYPFSSYIKFGIEIPI